MTRSEKAAVILALRGQGWTYKRIAEYLGHSLTYIWDIAKDPTGELVRERRDKSSRRGTCVDCAASICTRATRCVSCIRKKQAAEAHWTQELIIDAIQEYARRYGAPPTVSDWLGGNRRYITEDVRKRFYDDNCWPFSSSVHYVFGSWRDALIAAGFADVLARRGGGDGSGKCKGCGIASDQSTRGCSNCSTRHAERRRRAMQGKAFVTL